MDQINTADGNARAEGAAAIQMATDSTIFEKADGDRVRQSLMAYERAAVAEWPTAGQARSPDADSALRGLYDAYGRVQPKTDSQKTTLATSLSNLDKMSQGPHSTNIHGSRRHRTSVADMGR